MDIIPPIKNWLWDDCSVSFLCPYCEDEVILVDESRMCRCGKTYRLSWHVVQEDTSWTKGNPPITENKVGDGSLVWYEVMYKDGTTGMACWWYDHWYCCVYWGDIVAYRLPIDKP